jgi:hypothetical protein
VTRRRIIWNAPDLPISDEADVVVVGGGIAGAAAALAAARCGVSVLLVEKTVSPGGLATSGNVIVYLPLCDGNGRKVTGGIAEELLRLAEAGNREHPPGVHAGHGRVDDLWRGTGEGAGPHEPGEPTRRYLVEYNAATFALDLEARLTDEGVSIRYDTRCVDVVQDGGRISHVVVADKSGLSAIACRALVDASGDADPSLWAGERIVSCGANVACGWFYYTVDGSIHLSRSSEPYSRDPMEPREGSGAFACESGEAVTAQVLASRTLVRKKLEELVASHGEGVHPIALPQVPTFRMTRRLRGRCEHDAERSRQPVEDRIGYIGDWRAPGPVYAIPFGSLVGTTRNLLVAGRCISVGNDLWDATRAIPCCALTGEASGAAAAIATKNGVDPTEVDLAALQRYLRDHGALVDPI